MLETAFDIDADSQEDGTTTPTDTGVFTIDRLQDKLSKLQVDMLKPQVDTVIAQPLDMRAAYPTYTEAEEAKRIKAQLALLSPLVAGPLPIGRQVESKVLDDAGIPPPPQPHPVARPSAGWQEKIGQSHVISVGSVGHPFRCAEACKYVKRKGGCRDGANCTKCHECFWSRLPAGEGLEQLKIQEPVHPVETAQPFSVGSAGHPYTCSAACKYVWRKQGCRDGADCPNCHYCKWQRRPKEESESPTLEGLDSMLVNIPPPPGLTPMQPMEAKPQENLSSLGSLGHPYSCGLACKYVGKAKGCKDGTLCPNCHLCRWSRYANLKVFHL